MSILIDTWRQPEIIKHFNAQQWQTLVRQARASHMLARVGHKLAHYYECGEIEERIWHHFSSAMLVAQRQNDNTKTELDLIDAVLTTLNINAIILKGAAYSITGLPVHRGRTYSDIDILVDKAAIKTLENTLWFNGFISANSDDYDEKYYRLWMHEIPPLQHIKRKTVLDVHHNILPLTGSTRVNIEQLKQDNVPISGYQHLRTLSFESLILHSATHLYHEGEFEKGLTDLVDLEMLLVQYLEQEKDLTKLINQAQLTGLTEPLYFAITQVNLRFGLVIKYKDLNEIQRMAPQKLTAAVLNWCFNLVLTPYHSSCDSSLKKLAALLLYWRGHLLRMPLRLLIPHLCKKTVKQLKDSIKRKDPTNTTVI